MKKIYISIEVTKPVDGLEAHKPQPAMGNMKPTTEGYQGKWDEKVAKINEDLASNGIFSDPVRILVIEEGIDVIKVLEGDGIVEYVKSLGAVKGAQFNLVGYEAENIHRMLVSFMIRKTSTVPEWLLTASFLDPFKFVGGSTDLAAIKASLGLVTNTVQAAKRLSEVLHGESVRATAAA